MKYFRNLALFLSFFVFSLNIFADDSSAQLESLLSNFNAMTANFSQTLYDQSGTVIQKNLGKMALLRPGKFRWEVQQSNQQLLIADGKYLWVYDEDLQQATRQKIHAKGGDSPAALLSGSIQSLRARFDVSKLKKPGPGDWFELTPSSNKDMFKWIQLHFVDNKLTEMQLLDTMGQLSNFSFSDVQINPALDSNLFKFKPPKGVDLVKG